MCGLLVLREKGCIRAVFVPLAYTSNNLDQSLATALLYRPIGDPIYASLLHALRGSEGLLSTSAWGFIIQQAIDVQTFSNC